MCCEKYRCTPWKNELARHFIAKEDGASLQKLTDLSTGIHGEVNSLYDLMLSFLESGRIRQAKKILETPGLRLRHDKIKTACTKYTNEGAVGHLENLLELTKDIGSVNRSELYYSMLQAQGTLYQLERLTLPNIPVVSLLCVDLTLFRVITSNLHLTD